MDRRQKKAFEELAGGGIRFDYPMRQLTTFRVGGAVEALWEARHMETLKKVIRYFDLERIPYGVLGRGSNLLVRDDGMDGVMLLLKGPLAQIREDFEASVVRAGGGVYLADLMNFCRRKGFSGLEFLAGIPGTVGGAVVMNAGAFGREINEKIRGIEVVTPQGGQVELKRSDLKFSYRCLHGAAGHVVTNASFYLKRDKPEAVAEKMQGFLRIRKDTQPLQYPSAGSVFKNPPGDYAGRVIEKAGLKGKRVGGAMVSEKHANYIVNTGGASAKDILTLMNLVCNEVKRVAGINLEPEIRILGK